ncbi:MAG: hypothetical protein JWR55_3139 [Aeromicrobium sp.]|jgi:hypothetical protein|nr:hypothetical protein [Aeromicrobium sp.]
MAMRTTAGWALVVLGVLVALAGGAAMVVLGPDSRFTTGPHAIETDDIAVVTAPDVIGWADVQVDLLAEVPVRKPIFVGIGNAVDVQDFVGRTQRLEVTGFQRPWDVDTREAGGTPNLPGAPTALDWWIDSSAGLGGASISTQLPDETISIAILSVGSSNLSGLEVTLAYGVKGGFGKGAAALLLGLGLVVLGLAVRRARPWDEEEPDDEDAVVLAAAEVEEEVVYVYVDDDGVEHEISAEEAAELQEVVEVVEVVEVEEVVEVAEPGPRPEVEPAGPADEDAAAEAEEEVVYVYVDDEGVEHEVNEDELAEFEIVDEEDRP